jgi:WD40 repeat protein
VVGGVSNYTCATDPVSTSAEIYDPATGQWSPTGSIQVPRSSPAIALLADGKVLVAGGGNRCSRMWNTAELYDPATGEWTLTDPMNAARQSAAAVRLTDGRVLVAGGIGASPFASLATAELYDPESGTWAATGSMWNRRYWTFEDMAALDNFLSLLPDGRVFTAGGVDRCGALFCARNILNTAELYDPATGDILVTIGVLGPDTSIRSRETYRLSTNR